MPRGSYERNDLTKSRQKLTTTRKRLERIREEQVETLTQIRELERLVATLANEEAK